ncbi:MAG: type II toxin-antitoxin system VapC family toxin [Brevundimonas sp.]|uniref:type II toxin-antitoxin system VapC family toxin n=1 Tax=Brevundimonas sp. TaxID=1871086 RepID=UPI0040333CE5
MTPVVVDASAALAWLLPSQATATAHRLLERADEHQFIVPDVFIWEVSNVLMAKTRSHSVVLSDAFDQLDGMEIAFDDPLTEGEVRQLTGVATTAGLSLFDAAYLALAIERSGILASRDGVLLTAAMAVGVDVFDLRG